MEQKYCIRRANVKDKDKIIQFINDEWKKAQTINDGKLFEYYYGDGENLNFLIALKEKEIVGACGFARASGQDIWLSNLLVKKGESPTLVFRIIKLFQEEGYSIFCVNIVSSTAGFYKILNYEIGELKHYYKLFDKKEYQIAIIKKKQIHINNSHDYQVIPIASEKVLRKIVDDSIFRNQRPQKSIEYVVRRYFEFPYAEYEYKVWAIEKADLSISTLLITREQIVENTKILRIVDIIGSEIELLGIGYFFENLGIENAYEYIDCWCYGLDDRIMSELGFMDDCENIIPERLDPLERVNDKIEFAISNIPNFRAFHADADMDRPNLRH